MTIAATAVMAAEEHGTSGIEWVIGAVTLGILLALVIGLVAFGGGRDHS
ncbi:MAG: hypothetical protein ACSLEW_12980 [Nocardioides sp.]